LIFFTPHIRWPKSGAGSIVLFALLFWYLVGTLVGWIASRGDEEPVGCDKCTLVQFVGRQADWALDLVKDIW
jgi:hypothetical protein